MHLVDIYEIKKVILSCFREEGVWYEKSLLFSVLILTSFLFCILPFGFVVSLLLLPYIFVVQKDIMLAGSRKTFLKRFWLSARRYGRCLCIFVTKLASAVFVIPFLSLVFVGHIQSECEELDFKGVILLSRELSQRNKLKIFSYLLFLAFLLSISVSIGFTFLILLKACCQLSHQAQLSVMFGVLVFALVFVILPLWEKYMEGLYLRLKSLKTKEKQG